MKKKAVKQIFKIIVAGITSFAILCVFSTFYYNISVHYSSETGSTDYKWATNRFYAKATEGFAWGWTDKNGFNNAYKEDYDKIDVLFMGSSHIEAFNGQQKYNVVYQMNTLYEKAGKDKFVYNIGISGHSLPVCLDNLKDAIKEFQPTDTIVIETQTTHLNEKTIEQLATEGDMTDLESEDNKLLVTLAEIPFVRLMYYQYVSLSRNNRAPSEEYYGDVDVYIKNLDVVLQRASQTAKENGVDLIFVYNAKVEIDSDGKVLPEINQEYTKILEAACEKHSIKFVNMHGPFTEYYEETYRLPHGFSNTTVGTGHINRYGHQVIAQTVYDVIEEEDK